MRINSFSSSLRPWTRSSVSSTSSELLDGVALVLLVATESFDWFNADFESEPASSGCSSSPASPRRAIILLLLLPRAPRALLTIAARIVSRVLAGSIVVERDWFSRSEKSVPLVMSKLLDPSSRIDPVSSRSPETRDLTIAACSVGIIVVDNDRDTSLSGTLFVISGSNVVERDWFSRSEKRMPLVMSKLLDPSSRIDPVSSRSPETRDSTIAACSVGIIVVDNDRDTSLSATLFLVISTYSSLASTARLRSTSVAWTALSFVLCVVPLLAFAFVGGSVVENEAREYRLKASLLEQQLHRQSSEHDSVVQELR